MRGDAFVRIFMIVLSLCFSALTLNPRVVFADLGTQGAAIRPLVTTTELVKGENRFAFGLMKGGVLVDDANVRARIFEINGEEGRLTAEVRVPYEPIGNGSTKPTIHWHADGTPHVHTSDSDVKGLYVTRLHLPKAGLWGLELLVERKGRAPEKVLLSVNVLDGARTPAVGDPAPRSHNLIAADVKNLKEIDTSPKPDPRLHQERIAGAIARGKPQLVVFATPQYCSSRMCGPVVDIVRQLLPAYGKRIAFTHQEIWQDFAAQKLFPTVKEWRLFTEPWVFVVDGQGIIRAKFEGLVTKNELEQALKQVVRSHS